MHDLKVLRWTGAFGVAAGVLLLVASPLYVVMGTPPSLGDGALFSAYVTRNNTILITTKLVDMGYLVGFIVFVAGLRKRSGPDGQCPDVRSPRGWGRLGHVQQARPHRGPSTHRGIPRQSGFRIHPDGALPGGGELRHPGHASAPEVDWLAGCRRRRPQPRSGSRDLRGERLHGSRGCRGDHLRRLVRVHQRCQGARIHWVAPHRRHLDDAREAGGRRAVAPKPVYGG